MGNTKTGGGHEKRIPLKTKETYIIISTFKNKFDKTTIWRIL